MPKYQDESQTVSLTRVKAQHKELDKNINFLARKRGFPALDLKKMKHQKLRLKRRIYDLEKSIATAADTVKSEVNWGVGKEYSGDANFDIDRV